MESDACSNGAHRMDDVVEALQAIGKELYWLGLLGLTFIAFVFIMSIFFIKRQ